MGALKTIIVVLLAVVMVGPATAEEDPNALFNQGLDLARSGDTEAAVGLWLRVLDKVERKFQPSVHRTLGLGYGKLGRYPEAAYHLHRYLDTRLESQSRKTRDKLSSIEETLASTHTPVTISCDPAGATIHLGEEGSGAGYPCPLKWWFDKGRFAIRVAQIGYHPSITHVVVQEGKSESLHAVSLTPVDPAPADKRDADRTFLKEIKQAARAGQASVLRTMAAERGDLFKELSCEWGWAGAVYAMNAAGCHTAVYEVLHEAGATFCPTEKTLENAAQLGCPDVMALLLPMVDPAKHVRALKDADATYRGSVTLEQAVRTIEAIQRLAVSVKARCTDGNDSAACDALEEADESIGKLLERGALQFSDDDFIQLLAAHPKAAHRHRCTLVRKLAGEMNSDNCDKRSKRLAIVKLGKELRCDLRQAMERTIFHRCDPLFEQLLAVAASEDLAMASKEYNEGDRLLPKIVPVYEPPDVKGALAFGKRLHKALSTRCKADGPDSPACGAARHVEEQMDRIKAADKVARNPRNILKELCMFQTELDNSMAKLARLKRIEELSGVQKKPQLVMLAEQIVSQESNIESLATRYKKAAKKTYRPGMCQ